LGVLIVGLNRDYRDLENCKRVCGRYPTQKEIQNSRTGIHGGSKFGFKTLDQEELNEIMTQVVCGK